AADVAIGDEDTLEDRVVAARRAHAEDVPRLLDAIALRFARHERVDDLRLGRIGQVDAVNPEIRPDRGQTAERFPPGEPPAPPASALWPARRSGPPSPPPAGPAAKPPPRPASLSSHSSDLSRARQRSAAVPVQ